MKFNANFVITNIAENIKGGKIMGKFRSGLLAVILIMAMMVAGCGKGSTPSTDDTKPIEDIESVDEKNEADTSKEDSDSQTAEQENEDTDAEDQANSEDAEAAEQEQQEDTSSEDTADGTATSGSSDYTDEQIQQLYESIKETVQKDYLEANGISAEEFHWPLFERSLETGLPMTDEDNAWGYLQSMMANYITGQDLNNTSSFMGPALPSDSTCKLMRAVMNGMIKWYERPENNSGSLSTVNTYITYEELSKNIDFTN